MARITYFVGVFLLLTLPEIAFAAQTFKSVAGMVTHVINVAIPVVGLLIILALMWGILRYVFSNADPAVKGNSKEMILWGLIALFVVVSIWGIVSILQSTLTL